MFLIIKTPVEYYTECSHQESDPEMVSKDLLLRPSMSMKPANQIPGLSQLTDWTAVLLSCMHLRRPLEFGCQISQQGGVRNNSLLASFALTDKRLEAVEGGGIGE